jgi:hypothetical protein
MQFHYVVFYDTDKKKWGVELDTTAYFQNGNVWDDDKYREEFWGWSVPEDDSDDALLDQTLLNTLYSLVDIIPIPKEHENV